MNTNSPDVTELMERIRQEAHMQQRRNGSHAAQVATVEMPVLPDPLPPPPRPANAEPAPTAPPVWQALLNLVARARAKLTVSDWVPGFLRPLARNQGGYNGILLEAIERLGEANLLLQQQIEQQLHERTEALRADLQTQSAWLQALSHTRDAERAWMRAVEPYLLRGVAESAAQSHRAEQAEALLARVEEQNTYLRSDLDQLAIRNGYHETHASDLDHRLGRLQTHADEQASRLQSLEVPGEQLLELRRQMDTQGTQIQDVNERMDRTGQHVSQLGEYLGYVQKQTDSQNKHLVEVHENLDRSGQHLDRLGEHLGNLQRQVDDHHALLGPRHFNGQGEYIQRVDEQLGNLQRQAESQGQHNQRVEEHLGNLQRQAENQSQHNQRVGQHLGNLQSETEGHAADLRRTEAQRADLAAAMHTLDERQVTDASYLKSQLALVGRLVQRLIDSPPDRETDSAIGLPSSPDEAIAEYQRHELDAFYLAFENRYRGSRSDIMERAQVHLGTLEDAGVGRQESPLLDLGAGRGEWLELLRDRGFTAAGVDLNSSMIEQCRERGLEVTEANALDFLRGLPDASRGVITAFHLIEHLPFHVLLSFVHECHRVLQPGGIVIFETPNPENIVVGATEFWGDFTHQRPVLPDSAAFLVEQAGFIGVRIQRLHQVPEGPDPDAGNHSELWERIHGLLYGPRDFAVVGSKACAS